jgi:hypothetical protein
MSEATNDKTRKNGNKTSVLDDSEIDYLKWFLDEERNDRLNRTKEFIELYKSGVYAGLQLEYAHIDQKYEDRKRLRTQSAIPIIVSSILRMEEKISSCWNCGAIACAKHRGDEND